MLYESHGPLMNFANSYVLIDFSCVIKPHESNFGWFWEQKMWQSTHIRIGLQKASSILLRHLITCTVGSPRNYRRVQFIIERLQRKENQSSRRH